MLSAITALPRPLEGVLLISAGVLSLALPTGKGRRRALAGALILGFALASLRILGAGGEGDVARVAVARDISLSIGLFGGGIILAQLGLALRMRGARWFAGFRPNPGSVSEAPADPTGRGFLGVNGFALLLVPALWHLHLLMLALIIVIVAGERLARRVSGGVGPPIMLWATVALLAVAWYFLARMAHGEPLDLAALRAAPYSPAFELAVSGVLCLVAWRLLGLWPMHGAKQGPAAPLLAGTLLVRLVAPVLPGGLGHWRPFLYLVLAAGACHAALTRRDGEGLGALAGLGLMSGDSVAGWSGLALVSGTLFVAARERFGLTRDAALLLPAGTLIGLLLLLPVLAGGLSVQVFYSVVTVGGAVALLWRDSAGDAPPGEASGSAAAR